MAEPSENSTATGKQRTGKTAKLTREQALEIFQQSVLECQKAGIDVRVMPEFYSHGDRYVAVLMANVQVINGNLKMIEPGVTGKE